MTALIQSHAAALEEQQQRTAEVQHQLQLAHQRIEEQMLAAEEQKAKFAEHIGALVEKQRHRNILIRNFHCWQRNAARDRFLNQIERNALKARSKRIKAKVFSAFVKFYIKTASARERTRAVNSLDSAAKQV